MGAEENIIATDKQRKTKNEAGRTGQQVLKEFRGNEIFIAIVGPAGAGAGTSAKILKSFLETHDYSVEIVKVSDLIKKFSRRNGETNLPPEGARKSLESIEIMQDRGDEIRKGEKFNLPEDHTAVARLVITAIRESRAKSLGVEPMEGVPIEPDGNPRAFIIDSLRHPDEVSFLREMYKDAFYLLGIVCDPIERERRIRENLFDRTEWGSDEAKRRVRDFLLRDENAPDKFGQHVSDTFYEADFFVDNTMQGNQDLTITGMNDQLQRFVSLLTQNKIIRPTLPETAMHHAYSAQMKSACLSRQVGAVLVDKLGNVVSTGANDVPKAGGGLYGESFELQPKHDERCAYRSQIYCSSNREQNFIIEELINIFPKLASNDEERNIVIKKLRESTRLGGLIEFSRAVHAEMDAILSASISGVSPRGARMYVTTYPCHYCARHIVAAGIDEVQFIEPYPKSKATELHNDSITTNSENWTPPSNDGSHVLFRPFVGVAPKLYRKVFLKDRSYKDKITGEFLLGEPAWGKATDVSKVSYAQLETECSLGEKDE